MIKNRVVRLFLVFCASKISVSQCLDFASLQGPMAMPSGYGFPVSQDKSFNGPNSMPKMFGSFDGDTPFGKTPPDNQQLSEANMKSMQNEMMQFFDNIPESEFFDICNQAVSMAESEAKAKGQTLEQYLQGQFEEMEKAGFIDPSNKLLAQANFKKDSSENSSDNPKPKNPEDALHSSETTVDQSITIGKTTKNEALDNSGNWLIKRSYSLEAKTLMKKAKGDIDKIAEQKLKLLEQIKNIDDSFGNFYKESGDIIGKTLTKSPDKKKQSPSFVIQEFLEQQLKKLSDSATSLDDQNSDTESDSKTDLGVAVYKMELVANECRKIINVSKNEIKKLSELEKMLSARSEQIEKNVKDAIEKISSISEKILQMDNSYSDVTAQKLYSEVEQAQQAIEIIKHFLESDETRNIEAIKASFDTTGKSITQQIKTINEKVTSVLNP